MSLDSINKQAQERAQQLVSDNTATSQQIIYRQHLGTYTKDVAAQTQTPNYTDHTVRAFRHEVTLKEVSIVGSGLKIGDIRWRVPWADLQITPGAEDRIVDGTTIGTDQEYMVLETVLDDAKMFWRLLSRKA